MKDIGTAMRELRADIERICGMSSRLPISGNVPADVAERLSDVPANDPEEFQEFLDEHVGAVVPYELKDPVQGLLETLWACERAEAMGGINKEKAYDQLRPYLFALRAACISRFRDL